MTTYLNYRFKDSPDFVSTYDELPLWSASFGLLLLKHLEVRAQLTVVDIGSGTGFPLTELAGRLGSSCKIYGIDPWTNANKRTIQKIKDYNLKNVEVIEGTAEKMPFKNNSIDLIVSNLGINNFNNPPAVFLECYRVLKPKGKLILTSNLFGHWKEFYEIFYSTLQQLNLKNLVLKLKEEEEHRGTIESVANLFTNNGFKVNRHFEENFEMKFADGNAFLNHHFVKLGWLTSWINLFPKNKLEIIFTSLEKNLNKHAVEHSCLILSIPMLYMEGLKQ